MKTLILTVIALIGLPSLANAQQLLNIYCEECRDLTEHPEDARNFAYNQFFGSSSWLTFEQADRFRITDNFGNTVEVDMNVDYQLNLFLGALFELGSVSNLIVDALIIQIRIIYPNLDIETYLFSNHDVQGDLPVGDDNTRSGMGSGGTSGSGSEDDEGFNDAGDYEYEDTVDEMDCSACSFQMIYPDGSLGDPIEFWSDEDWEELQEL